MDMLLDNPTEAPVSPTEASEVVGCHRNGPTSDTETGIFTMVD